MPNYEYECPKCGDFELTLRMCQSSDPQVCPECGAEAQKLISATGFVLKGDNWPGKAARIKGQMTSKRKRLGVKQDERMRDQPPVTLAPNVEGERTGTWAEAKALAKSKGKDAASYEPLVRKEKAMG